MPHPGPRHAVLPCRDFVVHRSPNHLADLIRRHRTLHRSRWRRPDTFRGHGHPGAPCRLCRVGDVDEVRFAVHGSRSSLFYRPAGLVSWCAQHARGYQDLQTGSRWALCYRGVWPELDGVAGSPAAPAAVPSLPGCPGSARPPWFGPAVLPPCCPPGCLAAHPAATRPARVDLAELLLAVSSSSPSPAPPRPARPPNRPPPGPRASILQRCCLPRAAAHHPRRHPRPTQQDTMEISG